MNSLEVLYGGSSSQIEDVLADSDVACASALARCDVSQAMFDASALTQLGAACWGGLKHSQFLLQPLVTRDADRPPFAIRRVRALSAKRARPADIRVELDSVTGFERLRLSRGTGDRAAAHVEFEVGLLEEVRFATAYLPGLADDLSASCLCFIHERAVDVPAFDVEPFELRALITQIGLELRRRFLLGTIGRRVCDFRDSGTNAELRLQEKGGQQRVIPCHHVAREYVRAYIEAAGLDPASKAPLFQSMPSRSTAVSGQGDRIKSSMNSEQSKQVPIVTGSE